MLGIGGGVVFQALAPGDRQAAGGARLAEQQVGRRPAAFVAGPPHFEHAFHLVDPRQGHGLAGVEHHDGVGIDGGNFFDQFVLIAGQAEDRLQARPHKDHRNLGASWPRRWPPRGRPARCSGVYQLRRTWTGALELSGLGLDFDVVRAGGQLDRAAHIVEAVGGGNDVVLVGLQNVAVHAALECAGGCQPLAVEAETGVGAHGLKIDPVVARVWRP